MARVTENPDTPKRQKGELSGGTVVQPKKSKKRGVLFSCLTVAVLCIVLGLVAVLWIVAATGLVNVPVISRFAYEEPEPIRYVSPGVSLEDYVQTSLEEQVAERFQGGQLQDTSLDLMIPEDSFTTSLRSVLQEEASASGFLFAPDQSQVVFDAEKNMEFFFPLQDNDQNSALRLYLRPYVQGEGLEIEAMEMRLGSLYIPQFLTQLFVQGSLEQNAQGLTDAIAAYISLQEIEVRDKNMLIRGDINANIFQIQ